VRSPKGPSRFPREAPWDLLGAPAVYQGQEARAALEQLLQRPGGVLLSAGALFPPSASFPGSVALPSLPSRLKICPRPAYPSVTLPGSPGLSPLRPPPPLHCLPRPLLRRSRGSSSALQAPAETSTSGALRHHPRHWHQHWPPLGAGTGGHRLQLATVAGTSCSASTTSSSSSSSNSNSYSTSNSNSNSYGSLTVTPHLRSPPAPDPRSPLLPTSPPPPSPSWRGGCHQQAGSRGRYTARHPWGALSRGARAASGPREYPVDPTPPDIKSGVYTTDEFRMFHFEVRPCSRACSHDWAVVPLPPPGEDLRAGGTRGETCTAVCRAPSSARAPARWGTPAAALRTGSSTSAGSTPRSIGQSECPSLLASDTYCLKLGHTAVPHAARLVRPAVSSERI